MKDKTQHIPPESVEALIALPDTLININHRLHELEMKTVSLSDWRTWLKRTLNVKG